MASLLAVNSCNLRPSLSPNGIPSLPLPCKPPTAAIAPRPTSKDVNDHGWRRLCLSTVASIIVIGTSAGVVLGGDHELLALAADYRSPPGASQVTGKVMLRWSGKRSCPPWHANSLENIMPEDLPRPTNAGSGYRKLSADNKTAPPSGLLPLKYNSNCFSL